MNLLGAYGELLLRFTDPISVTGPTSNVDIPLKFATDAQPVYNRNSGVDLQGNAKPQSYWRWESSSHVNFADTLRDQGVRAIGSNYATAATQFKNDVLFILHQDCSAIDLNWIDTPASNRDVLKNELIAAAYNTVSGRGVFDPYRPVQQWLMAMGTQIWCTTTPPADYTDVIPLVHRINTAINEPADYDSYPPCAAGVDGCEPGQP